MIILVGVFVGIKESLIRFEVYFGGKNLNAGVIVQRPFISIARMKKVRLAWI